MSLVLTIELDTWLKRQIISARYLPDNDKLKVVAGKKFAPLSWEEFTDSQHVKFYVSEKSYLYAFTPHISLTKNGVNVLAAKVVVVEPLKQLVTAEQADYIFQTDTDPIILADLNACLIKFGITEKEDIRQFLAQCAH